MGRQSWGLLPEIANNSSTITKDTLPPMYSQLFDDGVQKRIFMNVNDTIVSYSADGTGSFSITSPQKGGLTYYDGSSWVGTPSGTSTQVFKGGYPPAWGTLTSTVALVSHTTFSGDTAKTITGLSPGVPYRIALRLHPDSVAAQVTITFNGDTGANYYHGGSYIDVAAATSTSCATGAAGIALLPGTVAASSDIVLDGYFSSQSVSDNYVGFVSNVTYFRSSTSKQNQGTIGGSYLGASALSTMTITLSNAGTGTATIWSFATA